jgi:hypothetical protein
MPPGRPLARRSYAAFDREGSQTPAGDNVDDRLAEVGIASTVGSCGDSYDNALAESVVRLFMTESHSPARPVANARVEFANLTWVDWSDTGGCLDPLLCMPPAEYEAQCYAQPVVA